MTRCEECGSCELTAGVKVMVTRARSWPSSLVDGVKCRDCGRAYPLEAAVETARLAREAVTVPAPPGSLPAPPYSLPAPPF